MEKSEYGAIDGRAVGDAGPPAQSKPLWARAMGAVTGAVTMPHPLVRYTSERWGGGREQYAQLPLPSDSAARPKHSYLKLPLAVACLTFIGLNLVNDPAPPLCVGCTQVAPLVPSTNISTVWDEKDRIIKWHQGAIRIPTEVWDEMGAPGEDKRWEVFGKFHEYLQEAYPRVHEHLKKTTVDTWGLVYEWEPEQATDRKPIFIAGHQDVVPVLKDTIPLWDHPPFSGKYDGMDIWGRGASDDKSTVTSVLGAIELLLERGWKPSRKVVLGFGHDEERGGMRGAPAIRDYLLDKYGKDSMAILLDEGSSIENSWGQTFGLPSVAEKGNYDLNVTVATRGGHSSIPPAHTGVGLAALLVRQLERHPYEPFLAEDSPIWGFLQCAAQYAPDMPKGLKRAVRRAKSSKKDFKRLPEAVIRYGLGEESAPGQGNRARATISTTQAIDLIRGGLKVNALPEVVTVAVNHRNNIPIAELQKRVWATLLPTVKELNLSMEGFGRSFNPFPEDEDKVPAGTVYLGTSEFSEGLEPSPISPSGADDPAWRLLAGTARGVWATRRGAKLSGKAKDELLMSPFYGAGNTDTRRYWDLTRNIYRWAYLEAKAAPNGHTVNERISADALVEYNRFFQAFILNADKFDEL